MRNSPSEFRLDVQGCIEVLGPAGLLENKFAKPSKFLSPLQADGVLRNFAPSGRVLLKRGTHVASYGVFASLNKHRYNDGSRRMFLIGHCTAFK